MYLGKSVTIMLGDEDPMTVLVVRVLKQKSLRVCDFVSGHWVKVGFASVSPYLPMGILRVLVPEACLHPATDV